MSYTFEKFSDEPIMILTAHPDFDPRVELEITAQEIMAALAETAFEQIYLIEIIEHEVTINMMLAGVEQRFKNEKSVFKHPKIAKSVLVIQQDQGEFFNLMLDGINKLQYLDVDNKLTLKFDREQALEYVRAQINN